MLITLNFQPITETERAALKLLSIKEISANRGHAEFETAGDPGRMLRYLQAYIDIMKQVIVP